MRTRCIPTLSLLIFLLLLFALNVLAQDTPEETTAATETPTAPAPDTPSPQLTETPLPTDTPTPTDAPTQTTTSTLPDGVYSLRLRTLNRDGAPGAWSPIRTFKVDTTPPAAPALTTPADGAISLNSRPTLTWSSVSGATRYQAV